MEPSLEIDSGLKRLLVRLSPDALYFCAAGAVGFVGTGVEGETGTRTTSTSVMPSALRQ